MSVVKNEIKEKYSKIPNEAIMDKRLSNGALRVFALLFTKPNDWKVYNKAIMKDLGIKKQDTLSKYWKECIDTGWITREKITDPKDGKVGAYNYRLNLTPTKEVATPENGVHQKRVYPKMVELNNNNNTTKKEKEIIYDEFMAAWNEYADKTGKAKILKVSNGRKSKIKARHKDFENFNRAFKIALQKALDSDFLKENKFFSFDWLITNDTNIVKVLEDKYKNKGWSE